MKSTLLVRASFAAAVLIASASVGLRAQPIPANRLRQNLFSACFVSDQEGWAVGDLGRIFHTTDAARTWERQEANVKYPFAGITCPDKDHIWVAGQMGHISFSADGGKTWTAQESGTDRQLLDIKFVNPQLGMAVGDQGRIMRTTDGGKTWTRIAVPEHVALPPDIAEIYAPGDMVLYALSFVDEQHAWIGGEFGVILRSDDGGLTWESPETPVDTSLFGIYFADAENGWAVGIEATMLHSTDGGRTWTKESVPIPKEFTLSIYDVSVQGQYGWAVGDSGYLLNSKDAGASWQLVEEPVQMGSHWFRDVVLRPDDSGFILGSSGLVLVANRDTYKALKDRL